MIKTLFLLMVLCCSQQVSAMTFLSGEELVTVKVDSRGRILPLSTRKSILAELGIDSSKTLTEEQGIKIIDLEEEKAKENREKAAER